MLLDGGFSQRQTRGRAIEPKEVELVMSPGKLAVGLEKGWIMRDSLVQEIDCLQQILSPDSVVVPAKTRFLARL